MEFFLQGLTHFFGLQKVVFFTAEKVFDFSFLRYNPVLPEIWSVVYLVAYLATVIFGLFFYIFLVSYLGPAVSLLACLNVHCLHQWGLNLFTCCCCFDFSLLIIVICLIVLQSIVFELVCALVFCFWDQFLAATQFLAILAHKALLLGFWSCISLI